MQVDDPVGAISVHGTCGLWGVLSVGLFADGTATTGGWNGTGVTGLFYGDAEPAGGSVGGHRHSARVGVHPQLPDQPGAGVLHRPSRLGGDRDCRSGYSGDGQLGYPEFVLIRSPSMRVQRARLSLSLPQWHPRVGQASLQKPAPHFFMIPGPLCTEEDCTHRNPPEDEPMFRGWRRRRRLALPHEVPCPRKRSSCCSGCFATRGRWSRRSAPT